jgi:CelD/BcsL family acetyltransferase involved in cellulose biosynthesis
MKHRLAASPTGWRSEIEDAARVPRRLFADWERLADICRLPLVAGPHWMQAFQRAFVPPGQGEVHAVYHGDRLVSVVPLMRFGRVSRTLAPMANEHSPIWSFALDTSVPYAAEQVLERLLDHAERLQLARMRRSDPAGRELARAGASRGLPAWNSEYSGDVSIELGRSFDDVVRGWSPRMAKDARRRLRQLDGEPDLVIERADDEDSVARVLDACLALEVRTWKGEGGTAMKSDPRVRLFYEELARTMAPRGSLVIYLLRRRDRVVAFDLALRGAQRLDSLKIAYDPEDAKLAPGNLLTLKMLEREIDERVVRAVHLGRPSPHKARFATKVEPLCSVRIFGDTARARAAYLAGPVLRVQLKKHPWMVALHRKTLAMVPRAGRAWGRVRQVVSDRLERTGGPP